MSLLSPPPLKSKKTRRKFFFDNGCKIGGYRQEIVVKMEVYHSNLFDSFPARNLSGIVEFFSSHPHTHPLFHPTEALEISILPHLAPPEIISTNECVNAGVLMRFLRAEFNWKGFSKVVLTTSSRVGGGRGYSFDRTKK